MINLVYRVIWKQIPPLEDGILPYYYISNTGLIYSKLLNRYLIFTKDAKGYMNVRLRTINGFVTRRVHRLVLSTFTPIENYDLYEVNHINGIKEDNQLNNLEWVNHNQNMKHASRTGLFTVKGDNRNNSKLTENQVRMICQKISEGKTPKQISEEMNLENCNIDKIVMNIINGLSWKHISKDYDFSYKYSRKFLLSIEQVNEVCKYFEKNLKASTKEILDYLGIYYNDSNINQYKVAISAIRKKKNYKNICNKYKY